MKTAMKYTRSSASMQWKSALPPCGPWSTVRTLIDVCIPIGL